MSKEVDSFVKETSEKYDVPSSEIRSLYEEFEEEQKSFGVSEDDLFDSVKRRFGQYFAKQRLGQRNSDMSSFEVIPFGVQLTDYGAKRQYDKVMSLVSDEDGEPQSDLIEQAISEGYMNENEEPLYHKNPNSSRYGEVIDLEESKNVIYDVAYRENKEGSFEKTEMRFKQREMEKTPFLFTRYEVTASLSNGTLYGNKSSTFKKLSVLKQKDAENLLKTFNKEHFSDISDLENFVAKDDREKYNRTVVTKGDSIRVNVNEGDINNTMTLIDARDPSYMATCWLNDFIDIDFSENAQDVLVYGVVSWKDDDEMAHINVRGLFVPKRFKTGGVSSPSLSSGSETNSEEEERGEDDFGGIEEEQVSLKDNDEDNEEDEDDRWDF